MEKMATVRLRLPFPAFKVNALDSKAGLNPQDRSSVCRRCKDLCLACVAFLLPLSMLFGQGTFPPTGMPDENAIPPGMQPDVVFLKNEQGEQILVPRVRYEEFEKYLQSSSELMAENGNVALTGAQLDIQVDEKLAKIRATLSCMVIAPTSKWTLLPINLGSIQVVPEESEQASRVGMASTRNGYVWRLPPSQSGVQKLAMAAAAKIGNSNQVESLRLELPNTSTTITLVLPKGEWDVSASGNGTEVVEPMVRDGKQQYRILTSGGNVEIQWVRNANSDGVLGTEVLSQNRFVSSKLGLFAINSRFTFRGPKRLGGRRFLLELPEGSNWKQTVNDSRLYSGYRLSLSQGSTNDSPMRLALDIEESMSRNELDVSFDWNWEAKSDNDSFLFPMPLIDGVQKHSGTIEIVTPRNQNLIWDAQPEVEFLRRGAVADSPEMITTIFRVISQEKSLKCRLLRQRSNLSIRADYRVDILVDRIQATGVLDFQEDLRLFPFLQWETRDWKVERMFLIPTGKDLSLSPIRSKEESKSIIPLSISDLMETTDSGLSPATPQEPTVGKKIGILMTRKFDTKGVQSSTIPNRAVDLFMPTLSWLDDESQSRKSWVPSGELLIRSSFARLQANEKDWTGVEVVSVPSIRTPISIERDLDRLTSELPSVSRYQSQWSMRGQESELKLAFEWHPLLTDIECNGTSRLFIDERSDAQDQDWLLQFQGIAPTKFFLAVPKEWLSVRSKPEDHQTKDDIFQQLELTINGEGVKEWTELDKSELEKWVQRHPNASKDCSLFQFAVPETLLVAAANERTWLLTLRPKKKQTLRSYSTERIRPVFATLDCDSSTAILHQNATTCLVHTVPGTKLIVESFSLEKSSSIIQIGDKRWYQTKIVVPTDSPELQLIVANSSMSTTAPLIKGAWLQTVMKSTEMRHRLVTNFQSNQASITISLPPSLNATPKCILNGKSMELSPLEAGRYIIDLSSAPMLTESAKPDDFGTTIRPAGVEGDRSYSLEIFSWPTVNSAWWTKSVAMPTMSIEGSELRRSPIVWQVVSSRSDHLIATSESLSPSYRWKWSSLWLVRDDQWNQETLEKQFDATSQPIVESQVNRYTLVALDEQNAPWIMMVPRIMIWVPAALVALVAFFLVSEFHWLRNKYLWVAGLLLLVTLSQWAFDSTLLFSQALVAASGLSLTFFMLRWTFDRNSRRKSVFSGRPSQIGSAAASRPDSKVESPSANADSKIATTISPAASVLPPAVDSYRTDGALGQ
jgi:hypothetical protein